MMSSQPKLRALIFSGLAVAAILLLAVGLPNLQLQPARPFPFWDELVLVLRGESWENLPGGDFLLLVVRGIYLVALVTLPLGLIYLAVSSSARRAFLRLLLRVAPYMLTFLAFALLARFLPRFSEPPILGEALPSEATPYPDLLPVLPSAPPVWLPLVLSLVLSLLLAGLAAGVFVLFWRRRRRPAQPWEQLRREAQQALDALQAGADLQNTVIRCYYEMSRALSEQRGIRRKKGMTPREFEQQLEENGLPGEPVRQLTRLFEAVRYGALAPGEQEERQAIASLTAIVAAFRSPP